jgi:hypothetical protein
MLLAIEVHPLNRIVTITSYAIPWVRSGWLIFRAWKQARAYFMIRLLGWVGQMPTEITGHLMEEIETEVTKYAMAIYGRVTHPLS